jgi:hypothetical protein
MKLDLPKELTAFVTRQKVVQVSFSITFFVTFARTKICLENQQDFFGKNTNF